MFGNDSSQSTSKDGRAYALVTMNDGNHENHEIERKFSEMEQEINELKNSIMKLTETVELDKMPSLNRTTTVKLFDEFGGTDSFLSNEDGVDIYQLIAFQCKCRPDKKEWPITICNWEYEFKYDVFYYNIFKGLVTIFVQISSIFVLLDYAFVTIKKEADKDFCDLSGDAGPKTMAISYTTFLSLILWSTIQQGRTAGFYKHCNEDEEDYDVGIYRIVNYTWLTFGRTLCHGVILSAFSLSFLIIFYTTDPMDIILNAVALLFIADIDNMVVTASDYADMFTVCERIKKDPNEMNKYIDSDDEEGCSERCKCICVVLRYLTGKIVKIAVDIFALCMAITAPLLIIICY